MYNQRPTNNRHPIVVRSATLVFFAIVAALVGCAPEDASEQGVMPPGYGGSVAGLGGAGGAAGGLSTGGLAPGAGGLTPGAGGVGAGGSLPNDPSWCAVESLLKTKCQSCHGEEPVFGAPMSLTDHADLVANTPLAKRPAYQVALERVKATGPERMPPSPAQPLLPGDVAVLEAWINAGAKAGSCGTTGAGGTGQGGTGGDGGAIGSGGNVTIPGSGGTPTGPFSTDNYPADNVDVGNYSCPSDARRLAFRAHNNPGAEDKTPFDASKVGANGQPNSYECFYYEAPWTSTTQLIGSRPIIDNKRVIHHWLLYASNTPPGDLTHGGTRPYCQFQPDSNRQLLAGWAPGTPGAMLPANVGQALPQGQRVFVTLEVHYFNTKPGEPAQDRSGVEVCLTDTPRQNVASMHWLGTENINIPPMGQHVAGDTCTPTQGKVSTILRVWPHAHLTATHAKMELIRQNGTRQILHDGDFAFDNQTMYEMPSPVTVNPGDKLDVRCTYQNKENRAIAFGEGSNEEMCYIFTLAYPAGSLHNGKVGCLLPLGCVPGGILRCIDNENILTAIGGL